jgi:nucleotide-binding universal stress UspA family protein
LVNIARKHGAGLLAVGSRGRRAVKAAFLGSVSRRLISVADRPIIVVSPRALESADRALA